MSEVVSYVHGVKCWPAVDRVSPCEEACPLHMDVPSYVMAISQGKFKEALEVIRETNPFPSICGRVCHHPCEAQCTRAIAEAPIAIQWLKRFAIEKGLSDETKPEPAERTNTQKVAVVGSGPAGLTAAHDLVKQGYGVTVFEAAPIAGGMLARAIPEFILPQAVVQAEVDYIKGLGVEIKTNTPIGLGLTLDALLAKGYSAVLLATGAQRSATLPLPGSDLPGIFYALPLLEQVKLGGKIQFRGKVVIIGGGNVAMDVARTALRLGAQEVHITCLEARRDMPAFPWEIEATEKEGARLHPSLAPQQFRSQSGRRVTGVDFRRVTSTWIDKEGKISWTLAEGPGSEYSLNAEAVIIAIGQHPDTSLAKDGQLKTSPRGTFAVDADTFATSQRGVFAVGDCVVGAGTVVESMAAGRQAAASIIRYLGGDAGNGWKPREVFKVTAEMIPEFLLRKERWQMPALPSRDASRCFSEVKLGYGDWQGVEEAKRCLNCRMCGSCLFERDQLCSERGSRLL